MKVLIIPSWYPTKANHIVGSFFREQAALMQDEFEVKVLYGIKNEVGYKRYFFDSLLSFFKKNSSLHSGDAALSPPDAISFKYAVVREFKEEKNFEAMLKSYDREFGLIINKGWKPDLIHAHATVYAGMAALSLSKKYSIPFIITEHQVFLLHDYSKFIQKKIFKSLESANKVLAVSYHQMRAILMHGINCAPVVVGNYIDENLFFLKKRETANVFRILNITYPSYIKDNETFFKAISSMVKEGHTDVSVTIVGNTAFHDLNDANMNVFEEMAKKYEVSAYCHFIPFVERKNMPSEFHNHDVFVSTSIAETFGVAICEAMSTGMPVVSTLSGGVDDTVNNSNGIKVNIRDYAAVAEALIKIKRKQLIFDPETVRKSVVNKFGQAAFKTRLRNIYHEAISESKYQEVKSNPV